MAPARRARLKEVLTRGAAVPLAAVPVGHQDIAFLQYTGGTTGVSKGAMLTHRNIIANLQQAHAWIKPVLINGEEIIITALPLYHIFALTANCLTFLKIGATNVLITNPRDIPGFIKELAKYRFTTSPGSIPYSMRCSMRRVSPRWISVICTFRSAVAWRCRNRWPICGSR